MLGRVFGYKAIIQSSILVQPTAPKECWANILEELYIISQQKSWVREECAMIFFEAVKAIAAENGDEKLVQQIVEGLCKHGLAKTPEGVAIWLAVQSAFPKMELPGDVWHKQDPLCTKERQTLANVMKENFAKAEEAENGKKVKSGSSQPTLNFAWEVVMVSFMQRHGAGDSGVSEFSKFWTDIVDSKPGLGSHVQIVSNIGQTTFSRHRRLPSKNPKGCSSFQECLQVLRNGHCSPYFPPTSCDASSTNGMAQTAISTNPRRLPWMRCAPESRGIQRLLPRLSRA